MAAGAGTSAVGYWSPEDKTPCARNTPAEAKSARMKTHNRPAVGAGLHEWEAQLIDITTTEKGSGTVFHFFRLNFTLIFGIRARWIGQFCDWRATALAMAE